MKAVCSVILVKELLCISREIFNKDEVLLVDSVSREKFLPYLVSLYCSLTGRPSTSALLNMFRRCGKCTGM